MQAELTLHARRAARVVASSTARRVARSGALWGLVFGLYVVSSVTNYTTIAKTAAERAQLATSLGTNAGLHALFGVARQIDTVAGFTAWRSLGVLGLLGAVWGLLTATRLTRGEEDAGRWEVLLAGQTTRRRAAIQALIGLGAGLGALWVVTAVSSVAIGRSSRAGFTTSGSLFLSVALVSSAALFLAFGALAGQLASRRRQANGLAAGVLGVAYLLRMVADSGAGLEWLRWVSPLGWVEALHPLTGSEPLALVPIVGSILVAGAGAAWLAGDRDLGASALPAKDTSIARIGLLGGAGGLGVRLVRPVAVGWTAGVAVFGLIGGLVAGSAAAAVSGSAAVREDLERLGGSRGGAAAYLGFIFVIFAGLLAFAAAGQIGAIREEEAEGYVDHLLARPLGRSRWLADRLAVAACMILGLSLVAGFAAWVGAASQHTGLGLGTVLEAGINVAPPALLVLGAAALVYGMWPRAAAPAAYGLVAWSFLIQLVGLLASSSRFVLDTSIFHHIAPAPAADPNWISAASLAALGLLGAVLGIAAFRRRDLASA